MAIAGDQRLGNADLMSYFTDQRALSPGELQEWQIHQIALAQNCQPVNYGLDSLNFMHPYYARPAYVPQGWQDWYECGDQLH